MGRRSKLLEFTRTMKQPIAHRETPGTPSTEILRLGLRLIAEEFFEILEACEAIDDSGKRRTQYSHRNSRASSSGRVTHSFSGRPSLPTALTD